MYKQANYAICFTNKKFLEIQAALSQIMIFESVY